MSAVTELYELTLQNDIFMTSKSESDHAATFSRVCFLLKGKYLEDDVWAFG